MTDKVTFEGYWPDEEGETHEYPPWSKWELRLWEMEAGDWVSTREDILRVLELSGVESLDELLQGETKDNDERNSG